MAFRGFMGWERGGRKSRGERQINQRASRPRAQIRPSCSLSSAQIRPLRPGHLKRGLNGAAAVTGPNKPPITVRRGSLVQQSCQVLRVVPGHISPTPCPLRDLWFSACTGFA